MKVDKLTLVTVFDRTERLEAPLFQRPYVWNEERNWVPLWDSIREVAEQKVAGKNGRPHFLGAVVMDQLRTVMSKVSARQIIDGQQRLTTLQIALAAARDLSEELKHHKFALAFRKLTDNDFPLSVDPDEVFKVWPTNADRKPHITEPCCYCLLRSLLKQRITSCHSGSAKYRECSTSDNICSR